MNSFRHIIRGVCESVVRTPIRREKIVGIFICLLPLVLLIKLRHTFYVDWFNHLWVIEYFGEYIRRHGSVPPTLVTNQLIGIANPIFYGGKFYAACGLISSFLGSAIAFRAVASLAVLIQFWHVERAVYSASQDKSVSFAVATLVSWAIYPLTNLYNRSALTEFIAVAFLNAGVASVFVLVLQSSRGKKSYYDALAFGFLYAVSALTHPLTALFGGVFLILVGLAAWFALRNRWLALVGFCNLAMIALILSPWCYVVHRFGRSLPIAGKNLNKGIFRKTGFFPDSIDSMWSRLSPVPVDLRSTLKGIDVSTPYLDAQSTLPLVILACGFAWIWFSSTRVTRRQSKLLLIIIVCCSVVLFFLFLVVSVNPSLSAIFRGFFDILQFPYRLTTYINLATLTVVFGVAGLVSWEQCNAETGKHRFKTILLTGCLTISFSALVAKLTHADATPSHFSSTWHPGILARGPHLINLPASFYSYADYRVTAGFSKTRPSGSYVQQPISFAPDSSRHFGSVNRIYLELASPTLIITNVNAFPWNRLIVDGVQQRRSQIYVVQSDAFAPFVQSILISKGTHVLEYRFRPDTRWWILDEISWAALLLWATLWALAAYINRTREGCPRLEA